MYWLVCIKYRPKKKKKRLCQSTHTAWRDKTLTSGWYLYKFIKKVFQIYASCSWWLWYICSINRWCNQSVWNNRRQNTNQFNHYYLTITCFTMVWLFEQWYCCRCNFRQSCTLFSQNRNWGWIHEKIEVKYLQSLKSIRKLMI